MSLSSCTKDDTEPHIRDVCPLLCTDPTTLATTFSLLNMKKLHLLERVSNNNDNNSPNNYFLKCGPKRERTLMPIQMGRYIQTTRVCCLFMQLLLLLLLQLNVWVQVIIYFRKGVCASNRIRRQNLMRGGFRVPLKRALRFSNFLPSLTISVSRSLNNQLSEYFARGHSGPPRETSSLAFSSSLKSLRKWIGIQKRVHLNSEGKQSSDHFMIIDTGYTTEPTMDST